MRKLQNNKEKFGEFPEVVFFNELMTSDAHWKIKEDLIDLWRYQTSVAGASCKNKHWDSIQVNKMTFISRKHMESSQRGAFSSSDTTRNHHIFIHFFFCGMQGIV